MAGVWVFAENSDRTLELLNIARQLAVKMGVKLSAFMLRDHGEAGDLIARGADEVLLLAPLPEDGSLDAYVPVIAEEAGKADPDIFLVSATAKGKELAARIAARLDTGLCSQCTALKIGGDGRTLEMERLAYGGAAVQKVVCSTRPAMATIPPRLFEPAVPEDGREGQVRELPMPSPSGIRVLERKTKEHEGRDITEAKVVVCIGRGVEKREDMSLVRELSDVLGGEIGCTRPISEELHWLPEDLCIGLSGVQVKPDLYVGLGVSGQIQHVTGIRHAKVICAVNKDENAPIFPAADFGIVGDLYDIVPKLISELKKA